jgi:hypothetical protein
MIRGLLVRAKALPPSAAVPTASLAGGAAWYRDKHNSLQSRRNSRSGATARIRLSSHCVPDWPRIYIVRSSGSANKQHRRTARADAIRPTRLPSRKPSRRGVARTDLQHSLQRVRQHIGGVMPAAKMG